MAFITNFQAPVEEADLVDRFETDGLTNIDHVLSFEDTLREWTVDKECKIGDRVFFMCAATSKDHMAHVCKQIRELYKDESELIEYAEKEKALYKQYAGNIVAVGKVEEAPFQTQDSGYEHAYWRSPWYAKIHEFVLLDVPVNISEFRNFIKVSRTGSITRLNDDQASLLNEIILEKNPRLSFS